MMYELTYREDGATYQLRLGVSEYAAKAMARGMQDAGYDAELHLVTTDRTRVL